MRGSTVGSLPLAHQVAIDMPRFGFSTTEIAGAWTRCRYGSCLPRQSGPVALFDLPWVPLYLIFVYVLHPYLGALTFTGAFILSILTIVAELMTRRLASATHKSGIERNAHCRFQCSQRRYPQGDGLCRARGRSLQPRQSGPSRAADPHQQYQRYLQERFRVCSA